MQPPVQGGRDSPPSYPSGPAVIHREGGLPMEADSATPGPSSVRWGRIGKYQIVAHIATGGMGAVYKALDIKRGREVALKVLHPEQAASRPFLQERFSIEARYGRRLNHPNVASVYEYGEI